MKPSPTFVMFMAFVCAGLTAFSVSAFAEDDASADAEPSGVVLDSEADRISYAIGMQVGASILQGGIDVNSDALVHGIVDMIEENEFALSDEEMQEAMMALQAKMMEQQQQMQQEAPAPQPEPVQPQ